MNLKSFRVLFFIILACYPIFIYLGLKEVGVRLAGIIFIILLITRALIDNKTPKHKLLISLALIPLSYAVIFDDIIGLKFYPVIISLFMLVIFAYSLYKPPSVIEKIARFTDPDLSASGVKYTEKVTLIWAIFFFFNGCCALYTALFSSMDIWTLYNGLISYILMGLLMAIEWLVRLRVKKID